MKTLLRLSAFLAAGVISAMAGAGWLGKRDKGGSTGVEFVQGNASAAPGAGGYQPVEGDLIFQSLPLNPLIEAIEGSTGSPFSHCGILWRASAGGWMVLEAIGPVKDTPVSEWVGQGRDGRYTVFRLKQAWRSRIPEFLKAADGYKGRPYDIHYDMDDDRIYCSELIWKSFRKAAGVDLGSPQTLGELNWKPYESVIRRIENGNLPLGRRMITPRRVSEAPQLELVFEGGATDKKKRE